MDIVTYALLKKYVQASLVGAGALKGDKGDPGQSAFELAQKNGYTGTELEWLASLKGDAGKAPYIGNNGNWFIGDTDTNISATPVLDYEVLENKPTINGEEFTGEFENYVSSISISELNDIIREEKI